VACKLFYFNFFLVDMQIIEMRSDGGSLRGQWVTKGPTGREGGPLSVQWVAKGLAGKDEGPLSVQWVAKGPRREG
jgi:hypothetical protein